MRSQLDAARERLRFHLELQERFWLAVVVSDDSGDRQALRAEVERFAVEQGRPLEVHVPDPDSPASLAAALAQSTHLGFVWVSLDDGPVSARFLAALNERRDALRRYADFGLFLAGPVRLKVLLRELAPDLFSTVASVLEPLSSDETIGIPRPARPDELPERDPEAVRQWGQPGLPWAQWMEGRRHDAEQARRALQQAARLDGRREAGARRSRVGSLARAVEALLAQGWITEAAPVVEEMVRLTEDLSPLDATDEVVRTSEGTVVPDTAATDVWALSMLAEAYEARGVVNRAQGDLVAAEQSWLDALGLRERLVFGKPLEAATVQRFADVANVQSRLGELLRLRGRLDESRVLAESSLAMREHIAATFPDRLEAQADLGTAHSVLGDLLRDQGDVQGAAAAYEEAVRLRRAVLGARPENPWSAALLSVSVGRLAQVRRAQGATDAALELAEEALSLAGELVELDPGNVSWQTGLATAWSRLGEVAAERGDVQQARLASRQSLATRRRLAEEDPENARWQWLLAIGLGQQVDVALAEQRAGEAAGAAAEAADLLEQLVWQDPANLCWRLDWAESLVRLAVVHRDGGRAAEARAAHEGARRVYAEAVGQGATGRLAKRVADRLGDFD